MPAETGADSNQTSQFEFGPAVFVTSPTSVDSNEGDHLAPSDSLVPANSIAVESVTEICANAEVAAAAIMKSKMHSIGRTLIVITLS
jgi:hypothetical protein